MNNKCVVTRGISGAGKTTFLKRHFPEFAVVSADHYFERDGVYRYDASKINEAHAHCVRSFADLVRDGCPLLAVDNTNLRVSEVAVYTQLARAFGYDVYVFTLLINPAVASARSIHAVPVDKACIMANSMDPLPPWISQYLLTPDILGVFRARDVVMNGSPACWD